ncbi:hypothetical protein [Richelia sinica]|nr:hypothetical protein [Richelia sinica]MBD2665053.1 hypothetical protein [Richelia sinica FACHB-800]
MATPRKLSSRIGIRHSNAFIAVTIYSADTQRKSFHLLLSAERNSVKNIL